MSFFPFAEYWWFYTAFTTFILIVLALDLGYFQKHAHEVSFKEATLWTLFWIGLALTFGFLLYEYSLWKFSFDQRFLELPDFVPETAAFQITMEYLTGLLVEKALSIDNIFLFILVFGYFSIPRMYQHRLLFYGIIGALAFRTLFISLGSYLMKFHTVVIFFGALLILTGIKMFFASPKRIDLEKSSIVRLLKKIFRIHPVVEGKRFFIKKKGLFYATPLFVALVFIELSDVVFAIDSVPAIYAITKEPIIVLTSNIFAILGLRSMYFMLPSVMDRLSYLKYGIAAVLVFVGFKMVYLNDAFGGTFPIIWSLAIIVFLIGLSVLFSLSADHRRKTLQNDLTKSNVEPES